MRRHGNLSREALSIPASDTSRERIFPARLHRFTPLEAAVNHHQEDPERVRYGILATGEAPTPDQVETAERALEVVIMWGDNEVLRVDYLSPLRAYYVGESTAASGGFDVDYVIGADVLGTSALPVVLESAGVITLVIPHGASGDVTVGGERVRVEDLIASGHALPSSQLAGAHAYPLPAGASGRIAVHGFTFLVRPVNAGKAVGLQGPAIDLAQQAWTAASFAVHGLLLSMMYFLPPGASALSLELLNEDSSYAKYLVQVPELVEATPAWIDKPRDGGGTGKAEQGDSGQMGKQSAPKTNRKYAIAGPADTKDPHMARTQALREAQSAGILGVLSTSKGAWDSPTSVFGEDSPLGYDPVAALGALMGEQVGENAGFNGLGMRGTGRSGGGDSEGTIGVGKLGTIGHGAHDGADSGYGRSTAGMGTRNARVPSLRVGVADVRGSLSKEAIRREIHRHLNEVRACYEQELNARPDLSGRVMIKFIVAPTGAVQMSAVSSSTLGVKRAEDCISQAVRRWTFPQPDGGGIVVVSYPFVFDTAN